MVYAPYLVNLTPSLLVLIVLSRAARTATAAEELVLALEDNFDDFNLSVWKHELTLGGGGNGEFQWYANNRSNSYVEGGVLHLRPTLLADILGEGLVQAGHTLPIWGSHPADVCTGNAYSGCERTSNSENGGSYLNPTVSARIRTAESFSFTYGKVEVRARLPRGKWLWSAIRMLSRDHQYGQWPASGEIDIMNARGNPPSYEPGGYDAFSSSLHWGPYFTEDRFDLTYAEKSGQDFSQDFHVFGLTWTDSYIKTYLDTEDNVVLSVDTSGQSFWSRGSWEGSTWDNPWIARGPNAPFDRRFYVVINLAVGGVTGFFPDGADKPWNNSEENPINSFYDAKADWLPTWNQTFQIDSVKVWTYRSQDASPSQAQGETENIHC